MLPIKRLLGRGFLTVLGLAASAAPIVAQATGGGLSGQSLRPYGFVFLAYAVAWLLVLGWVVSIARRMTRLAKRLER